MMKALQKDFEDTRGTNVNHDKSKFTKVFRCNFQNQLYGATFGFYTQYDCLKLRAVEEQDGKVYVGVDLNQKPRVWVDENGGGTDAYIWDVMYWFIKSSDPNSVLEADLGYRKSEILNNQQLFYQSNAYKRIRMMLDSAVEDYTITSTLIQGEWPRLSDRSLLPVVVIDFDKNQMTYINRRITTDYRKNNDTIPIDIFASRTINEVHSIWPPAPLVRGQYKNKYAGQFMI